VQCSGAPGGPCSSDQLPPLAGERVGDSDGPGGPAPEGSRCLCGIEGWLATACPSAPQKNPGPRLHARLGHQRGGARGAVRAGRQRERARVQVRAILVLTVGRALLVLIFLVVLLFFVVLVANALRVQERILVLRQVVTKVRVGRATRALPRRPDGRRSEAGAM
jgi:hypothetical protein